MASPWNSIALVVAVAVLMSFCAGASVVAAQAPPPADCFQGLVNLSDCLSFFEKGSRLAQPEPGCCPGLSNLVTAQPDCFCKLLDGGAGKGQIQMPIDSDRAHDLPATCHVTSSFTNCVGQAAPRSSMDGTPGDESSANAPTSGAVTPAGDETSFAGISRHCAINGRLLAGISVLILPYLFPFLS